MSLVNAAGMPISSASNSPASALSESEIVIDSTDQDFMADVIEPSNSQPVLVDFWAPWCTPCKQYTPILEKAVIAEKGRVRLVKINVDDNPSVSAQLGVRSLPTTVIFVKGQPIQALPGVIPADALKKMMGELLRMTGSTSSAEEIQELLDLAEAALQTLDYPLAQEHYAMVLESDPEHVGATAGILRVLLAIGEKQDVEDFYAELPPHLQEQSEIQQAMQGLALLGSGDDAAVQAALSAVTAHPDDLAIKYQLAEAYLEANQKPAAVETLLEMIGQNREWNDKQAQSKLLEIFAALGFQDPLAKSGRQRLSAILFS